MDFSGRASQPQPANAGPQFNGAAPSTTKRVSRGKKNKWMLWSSGVLGLAVLALVVFLIVEIGFGGTKPESSYVDTSKLQAVFLNTGQVYFGNIKELNNKYFVLDNIYYLQTSSSSGSSTTSTSTTAANTSVSLVKLGCELHAPYDQMVINRDQVTFWENLQSTGQVATAVATFQKDNPNGQKCSDQSSTSGSTSTSVQNAGGGTTGTGSTTTPATTTTK